MAPQVTECVIRFWIYTRLLIRGAESEMRTDTWVCPYIFFPLINLRG